MGKRHITSQLVPLRVLSLRTHVCMVPTGCVRKAPTIRPMAEAYDAQGVEEKWQARWAESGAYQIDNDDPRPPFYVLCMYPYPSGPAHQGHIRNYTFGDFIVRHRTMQGYGVLSPDGLRQLRVAGRERGAEVGHAPPPVHRRSGRGAEGEHPPAGGHVRLAARGSQPRPRVHEVEPGDLPAVPRARPRLPQERPGELVPRLPDGSGQRAGSRRRHVRAVGRSGHPPRSRAVVLQDHRLRRRAAERARQSRVARAGQDHAAQLDRPLGGRRVPAGDPGSR